MKRQRKTIRTGVTVALGVAVAMIAAAGCSSSPGTEGTAATSSPAAGTGTSTVEDSSSAPGTETPSGGVFVFGASADPQNLDPALSHDGETNRVVGQIFEGLTRLQPGKTEIEAALAASWDIGGDGTEYTFHLRDGVQFSDGTPFDADAVCYNFERWYHFTGVLASPTVSYYWNNFMKGFADAAGTENAGLYQSCAATDDSTAVITLSRASASFLGVLSLPAFSIASPTALKDYQADDVSGSDQSVQFNGTFATEHPVGTGPFMFKEWTRGDHLTLVANPNYWGPAPQLGSIIYKPIGDSAAQLQALQAGDIDAYDNAAPGDVASLQADGFQVAQRPAFNVGYVGFNQKIAPMDNPKIREAVAYALNRQAVVNAQFGEGAEVATQFQPPAVWGYSDDVPKYDYDLDKAKQLVAESGVENPTLTFWYPTGVTRSYLPDAEGMFQAFANDLTAAGFTVEAKSAPWTPDYLAAVNGGEAAMYLLGWTGEFGDPSNFIGSFFSAPLPRFGFDDQKLFDEFSKADVETDQAKRQADYEALNDEIMDMLPGVPVVYAPSYVALSAAVSGYAPSPAGTDRFSTVAIG